MVMNKDLDDIRQLVSSWKLIIYPISSGQASCGLIGGATVSSSAQRWRGFIATRATRARAPYESEAAAAMAATEATNVFSNLWRRMFTLLHGGNCSCAGRGCGERDEPEASNDRCRTARARDERRNSALKLKPGRRTASGHLL